MEYSRTEVMRLGKSDRTSLSSHDICPDSPASKWKLPRSRDGARRQGDLAGEVEAGSGLGEVLLF
jgi:hypothetical protein